MGCFGGHSLWTATRLCTAYEAEIEAYPTHNVSHVQLQNLPEMYLYCLKLRIEGSALHLYQTVHEAASLCGVGKRRSEGHFLTTLYS